MPSKAAQLYAKLFGEATEVFPPGLARKSDVYRVWLFYRQENGGRMPKDDYKIFMPKLAEKLESHYKCFENQANLATLKSIKTTVARIIRAGDDLINYGGRIDDESFISGKNAFFAEIVCLQKPVKKEASAEVIFKNNTETEKNLENVCLHSK